MHSPSKLLLPIIVFSQFAGTSLWFAGNAIINEIQKGTNTAGVANITSLVQFGFITGTVFFAAFNIADRFKASKVFFFSSCLAALANMLIIFFEKDIFLIGSMRFLTGFFLAGIYPVGMKIAADWFPQKLGNALGFLVGALVLGTAFPHALKSQIYLLPWKEVIIFTSGLAFIGGLLILLFVPSKPPTVISKFQPKAIVHVFQSANFRSAAFGYFGHMWELYTFWAFVPLIIQLFNEYSSAEVNISLWSFIIIGVGCIGCIAGGLLSKKTGSKKVAFISLFISGCCCAFAPFILHSGLFPFLFLMIVWGFTVVSDSPQFSTLVAQSALQQYKGTALTIVTSIGFAITIISIQLLKQIFDATKEYGLWILLAGPIIGLLFLKKYSNENY